MKLVFFVCSEDSPQQEVKKYLPEDCVLLEKDMDRDGLQALNKSVAGIVLLDASDPRAVDWLKRACSLRADLTFVGITSDRALVRQDVEEILPYLLCLPFHSGEISKLLEQEWKSSRLKFELQAQKKYAAIQPLEHQNQAWKAAGQRRNEQILCEFSRALSSNFSRERLLELFSDTVIKLVPVGRISIILKMNNDGIYRVISHKGLDPSLCSRLSFSPEQGLMLWLAEKGRILSKNEAEVCARAGNSEIVQELNLLQAEVIVPLQAHGHLYGSINLGPKVTGAPFTEEEMEMIFILSGNVTFALRDIELHHQLLYQKVYMESLLKHLGSGVVAINSSEKIITCNRRALDLLLMRNEQLTGKDLRRLPSPLGDILFETMRTGKEHQKKELQVAGSNIFLEINTNQLFNEEKEVLGSVMIFDDISERKQLEEERRHVDRMEVLNLFVGHLAHEIKNPMVAIQTFTELIPEKYEDSSFREFFNHTVRQEVGRLNELVEQLIAFSSPLSYRFTTVDANKILESGLSLLREQGKGEETIVDTSYLNGKTFIKADKTLLPKALYYLLSSSLSVIEKGGELYLETRLDQSHFNCGGLNILFWDSITKVHRERVETLFEPLVAQKNDYFSLKLPVSKKIIEDHGGVVKASLKDDGRLLFEVLLPIISNEGSDAVEQTQNTDS